MTEAEAREFFEQVKGKRIKLGTWGKAYFIPRALVFENKTAVMNGTQYPNDRRHFQARWGVDIGFGYWQFVDPADQAEYARKRAGVSTLKNAVITDTVCTCCPVHGPRGIEKAFSNEKGVAT